MRSLSVKSTTVAKNTTTTNSQGVEITSINLVNGSVDFFTDKISHDLGNRMDYLIIPSSVAGTGELTLMWTPDGNDFYDAVDNLGAVITVPIVDDDPIYVLDELAMLSGASWKIDGANTAGEIIIWSIPK